MIVSVFKGVSGNHGFTPDGTGANLPGAFAPWNFVKTIDLNASQPRIGVNATEALAAIAADGFYVTKAEIVFKVA